MAAAASYPRKSASKAGAADGKIPEHLARHGAWGPVPMTFAHNVPLFCKGALQFAIMFHLLELSAFDFRNGRPEWVSVSYKDFTTLGPGYTEQAVAKALNYLADDLSALERQDDGRGRKYRIAYEKFEQAVKIANLQPRTLDTEDDDETPEEESDAQTELQEDSPEVQAMLAEARNVSAGKAFRLKRPAKFGCKKTGHETIVRSSDPSIQARFLGFRKGTVVLLDRVGKSRGEETDNSTPVESSEAPVSQPRARRNDSTPVESSTSASTPVSGGLARLESLLNPPFLQLFGKALDRPYAQKILAALGDAPPESLLRLIQTKRPKQSGLILHLAEDARKAFEAGQQLSRPTAPKAAPAGPQFDAEPDTTDSEWSQLRRYIRGGMQRPEYDNWFRATRQLFFKNRILTVVCMDTVTVEFMDQEYRDVLMHAAERCHIDIREIRFIAEGAQS